MSLPADFIEPRKRFLVKAGVALALMVSAGSYISDRYTFGADPNTHRCLADYRTFMVDHHQQEVSRDDLVAFRAEGLDPIFPDGAVIAKYVRGVPGDIVEITTDHEVLVNGEVIESGLQYASDIGMEADDFVGKMIIPEGEYWVMGDTEYSFDSRYWGTIRHEQISGKAHGIF